MEKFESVEQAAKDIARYYNNNQDGTGTSACNFLIEAVKQAKSQYGKKSLVTKIEQIQKIEPFLKEFLEKSK